MTRATSYTNAAQQRVLQLIDLLAGHELQGLTPTEIGRALGSAAPQVTRDLDNLRTAGWAELHPNGKTWRLAPHAIQISLRYAAGLQAGVQALNDTVQRHGTPPGMHQLFTTNSIASRA